MRVATTLTSLKHLATFSGLAFHHHPMDIRNNNSLLICIRSIPLPKVKYFGFIRTSLSGLSDVNGYTCSLNLLISLLESVDKLVMYVHKVSCLHNKQLSIIINVLPVACAYIHQHLSICDISITVQLKFNFTLERKDTRALARFLRGITEYFSSI